MCIREKHLFHNDISPQFKFVLSNERLDFCELTMQINFHSRLWSYLPRVPIFLAMTVCIYILYNITISLNTCNLPETIVALPAVHRVCSCVLMHKFAQRLDSNWFTQHLFFTTWMIHSIKWMTLSVIMQDKYRNQETEGRHFYIYYSSRIK